MNRVHNLAEQIELIPEPGVDRKTLELCREARLTIPQNELKHLGFRLNQKSGKSKAH